MSIFVLPKTHITKKHDKEWLLSAVALNTTFVYCPSCYIILPCVYTKNHEKKIQTKDITLLSSGVIVTDFYTVTAILRLPDVTLIDVLTPKKHIEFIFTNFLAFFSFYFFWT